MAAKFYGAARGACSSGSVISFWGGDLVGGMVPGWRGDAGAVVGPPASVFQWGLPRRQLIKSTKLKTERAGSREIRAVTRHAGGYPGALTGIPTRSLTGAETNPPGDRAVRLCCEDLRRGHRT